MHFKQESLTQIHTGTMSAHDSYPSPLAASRPRCVSPLVSPSTLPLRYGTAADGFHEQQGIGPKQLFFVGLFLFVFGTLGRMDGPTWLRLYLHFSNVAEVPDIVKQQTFGQRSQQQKQYEFKSRSMDNVLHSTSTRFGMQDEKSTKEFSVLVLRQ